MLFLLFFWLFSDQYSIFWGQERFLTIYLDAMLSFTVNLKCKVTQSSITDARWGFENMQYLLIVNSRSHSTWLLVTLFETVEVVQ